jgi:hypothetical protein
LIEPLNGSVADHVIELRRFAHPWLPDRWMLQTVNDHWQPEFGEPLPYTYFAERRAARWPPAYLERIRATVANQLAQHPSRTAVRIGDGDCRGHSADVRQPVMTGVSRG